MKILFVTLISTLFFSNLFAAEMTKGDIYITNISVDVKIRYIKLSGKINGFYCKKGNVIIIISGDNGKPISIKMSRHDFNGNGNYIEGVIKRKGDFENITLLDFETQCFDE